MPVSGYGGLTGEVPHCSVCKHPLRFYEYFPIFSFISTKFRFRCNYCGVKINPLYTILEITTGIMFGLNYFLITAEQPLILLCCYSAVMLLLFALKHGCYRTPNYIFGFAGFLGIIYRTLTDGHFYTWSVHILSIFIVILLMNKHRLNVNKAISKYAGITCACCWLPTFQVFTLITIHVLAKILKTKRSHLFYIDFSLIYCLVMITEIGLIQ